MSYPDTPESQTFVVDYDLSSQYHPTEWSTLDNFLEWQREQPGFSSPESLTSEHEASKSNSATSDYLTFEQNMAMLTSNFEESKMRWTQVSTGSASPSMMSPRPHLMPEDFAMYSDEMGKGISILPHFDMLGPGSVSGASENSGPQMPKIGRPRSTPTADADGIASSKVPGQARRRSQNREAQRAFRARQRQYIDQIAQENKELIAKNQELEERCGLLAQAYEKVLAANTKMAGMAHAVAHEGTAIPSNGNRNLHTRGTAGNVDSHAGATGAFGMPWNLVGQQPGRRE